MFLKKLSEDNSEKQYMELPLETLTNTKPKCCCGIRDVILCMTIVVIVLCALLGVLVWATDSLSLEDSRVISLPASEQNQIGNKSTSYRHVQDSSYVTKGGLNMTNIYSTLFTSSVC